MVPDFDRLDRLLFREGELDRVPFYEIYVDKEVMETITGQPLARMDLSNDKQLGRRLKCTVRFFHGLGYDHVSLRMSPDFPRDNILLSKDTAIIPRDNRQCLDEQRGAIRNREDLDEYPWPDLEELVDSHLLHLRLLRKHLPRTMKVIPHIGGIFENVTRLLGTVPFLLKLYKEPALVRDMFDKVGTIVSFYIKAVAEEDVGAVAYNDDMGYKTGLIMSPGLFRRYVFPWEKRCAENVHRNGKPFIFHSCGNLKLIMDDLISNVGIDAKHSYQDSTYPVAEYKKLYGHRIAILGGWIWISSLACSNPSSDPM